MRRRPSDADRNLYSYGHTDPYTRTNGHSYSNKYAYGHTDSYADTCPNGYPYSHGDEYSHTHGHADSYTRTNGYPYSHGDEYSHTHGYATHTPVPTATPTVTPTYTPVPTATPTPTVTNTPTVTPTNTPTPTPIELKRYMLDLINDQRAKDGSDPVVLGDNVAAQLHAESSLANCFFSHWGVDGLKPYMRYSLAGGYQSLDGISFALGSCITTASDQHSAIDIREEILELIDDTDFRDKILDPLDKRVNIGLAWDTYNYRIVLQLERDYVEYARLPTIENGILTVSGTVKNGAGFADERDLGVLIYYDQPPQPRTRGQLTRTSCPSNGSPIAALRPPPPPNRFYLDPWTYITIRGCPDGPIGSRYDSIFRTTWITASKWTTSSDAFSVRADISDLLAKRGNGVYSIVVWDVINSEDVVISRYSIFHGVTPPDTYDPSRYE